MEAFPNITVGIVQSRYEFIDQTYSSAKNQIYPGEIEVLVEDNIDKSRTIGACFNALAQRAQHEWLFFLGDDDVIRPEYLLSLAIRLVELSQETEVNAITSHCTLFNKKGQQQRRDRMPTGMWRVSYLLDHPFDESLERFVDTEYFDRQNKPDTEIAVAQWQYGYFYRQHTNNISGNKMQQDDAYPIQVYGHKRSGNHYLSELINKNFISGDELLNILGGHGLPDELNPDVNYLYILREKEDVLDSLWRVRHRQGLDAPDFETFCTTPYHEMWSLDHAPDVEFNTHSQQADTFVESLNGAETSVLHHFQDIRMTPEEYYDYHTKHWKKLKKYHSNVKIVRYEDLQENFQETMEDIATFLHFPVTEYEDIVERVGWYVQEPWEKGVDFVEG